MSAVKLSPRLEAIAGFVRTDKAICDVGTDHALLACRLYELGARKIIASDINDGPLHSAEETVMKYIGENSTIELVKSDGLDNIPFAEDIIVAGMGGELIARIVTSCRFLSNDTRFILQPMTKAEILRKELYSNGFEITEETTVQDSGRLYVIMYVRYTGNKKEISLAQAVAGKITDTVYLKKQALSLENAASSCKSSCPERAGLLYSAAEEINRHIKELCSD